MAAGILLWTPSQRTLSFSLRMHDSLFYSSAAVESPLKTLATSSCTSSPCACLYRAYVPCACLCRACVAVGSLVAVANHRMLRTRCLTNSKRNKSSASIGQQITWTFRSTEAFWGGGLFLASEKNRDITAKPHNSTQHTTMTTDSGR